MIRLGKNITAAGDQLYDVALDKVYKALINANGEVASMQRRLQAIRAMDPAQYRKLKVSLPYVVCAQFHPKIRRKENFLFADRFLIDIDHISEHGLDLGVLRDTFSKDPRVELMFASPSGDGLKILFRIEPRISDPAYYVLFYKAFCLSLENTYKLGAALDHKTFDVSRCCFVSFDPEAYYNPEAEPIDPTSFVSKESMFELDAIEKEAKKIQQSHLAEKKELIQDQFSATTQELPDGVLSFIKEKTGEKVRKAHGKIYEQPEQLEEIMGQLQQFVSEINGAIESVKPIAYGRQVRINSGKIWAEINIFFGKRGVSVVPTTKTGSHREFGKSVSEFLKASFDTI